MVDYEAFITRDRVTVVDGLPSRKTALHQLAEFLASGTEQLSYRDIFFKLQERERQGSTVLDELPVAIPHCRIENCLSPIGSLLKIRQGNTVDFGGQDVTLLVGMCFPQDAAEDALAVLRTVVRLIEDSGCLRSILATESPDELFELFRTGLLTESKD
ncbi:MAG: PTS sugar transporter subunit IIA [Gammaproteobacteria bacterium]|nr:PTS sugar transporter subunit IIA [Gammaproteobacteria bacterium]